MRLAKEGEMFIIIIKFLLVFTFIMFFFGLIAYAADHYTRDPE